MDAYRSYLALDLELNNASDGSTPNPRIIQVGVAWGSWDHYEGRSIQTRRWYLDPQEPIYPEITTLTGITDQDIAQYAVSHQEVANEIDAIMQTHDCFVNPVTWGGGDSVDLLREFTERSVTFRRFGHRWIDVKTWFIYQRLATSVSTAGGLSKSMPKFGIQFDGTPHRADEDAYNTLRLFFAMLDRQNKMEYLLKLSKEIK